MLHKALKEGIDDIVNPYVIEFIHTHKDFTIEDITDTLCPQDFSIPCKFNNLECHKQIKACEECWKSEIRKD